MLGDWTLALKNLFLPEFCTMCGRRLLTEENGFFCPDCWELSPRIERPFCPICGRPHPAVVGVRSERMFPCAACSTRLEAPPYRRILGAACFEGAVAEAIKLFKFQGKTRLARPLGALMAEAAGRELDCAAYDYLVPVPLHRVRERARGFNQSRLLARAVAPAFPNGRLDESLRRLRPTRVQSLIADETERRANVAGAFALVNGEHLEGATILLVDDVTTSAGTVSECADALRCGGAHAVDVLVAGLAVRAPDSA
ncbi:MAG: ComF family protein [Candidatus Hydrogenedentes bacterium]|nr:ComF family protein [Candidatus Hydrogenedentota bacterium]